MTVIGYATLSVIPEMKGVRQALEKQSTGDLTAAGKKAGKRYGDAAGATAATGFRGKFSAAMKGFAPLAGLAAGVGVVSIFKGVIDEAREAGQVSRVTAKLIETTGSAAHVSAAQVSELAGKMMDYAAVDDELIQSGANVLLTFKNVQNAAGEGNAVFDRAVKAGLDLAAVLKTDLSGSALQLGKALNDPIKGMTALGRAGVQFTTAQKEQIKALVQSGRLLEAQKIILTEVEGQVGGAAGAAADGTKRLSVALGNLKESLGTEIMPAVEGFSNWAADEGIPALSAAGGAAKDAAEGFGSLPAPVQTATAAFIALRLAAATSLGTTAAAGVARLGSAMTGLQIRTLLARDAFTQARTASLTLTGANAGLSLGAGRVASSFAAVRAGAVGATAAMRGFGAAALAAVGGPATIAIVGATAALTLYWQQHQKSKEEVEAHRQRVESLTATLDKNTGAITSQTRAEVAQRLEKQGLLKDAQALGISLSEVTDAALGTNGAFGRLKASYEAAFAPGVEVTRQNQDQRQALSRLFFAISDVREESEKSVEAGRRLAAANREGAAATGTVAVAVRDYARDLRGTRSELRKLIQAEADRALQNIQNRRDAIALRETFRAAHEEARKGKDVLFDESKAADANMSALLDLGNQWNESSKKVTNAKGAYEDMRTEFIEVARGMGATEKQAENLARQLLKVPKTAPLEFQSKGYRERLREIQELRRQADLLRVPIRLAYSSQAAAQQAERNSFATGGWIGGVGSGTSDSNLIWASRGEFMQRKAAVDYYGVEFMRKLNALQVPKIPGYAAGGQITERASAPAPGVQIQVGQVVAHDYADFMGQLQRKRYMAQMGGVRVS